MFTTTLYPFELLRRLSMLKVSWLIWSIALSWVQAGYFYNLNFVTKKKNEIPCHVHFMSNL